MVAGATNVAFGCGADAADVETAAAVAAVAVGSGSVGALVLACSDRT